MGVLGLTPFIQKYCPEVIKELPYRLKTLSGKTIAVDGTLITQRLHFAPTPCQNRHILGWYRLIRELKESGIGVICVFDGAERGLAKQYEGERRRKVQRMEAARGAIEVERLRRLCRLTELLNKYQEHPRLRNEVCIEVASMSIAPQSSNQNLGISSHLASETPIPSNITDADECFFEDEDDLSDYFDSLINYYPDSCGLVSARHTYAMEPPHDMWTITGGRSSSDDFGPPDIDRYGIYERTDGSECRPDDVTKGLLSLYHDYHQTIPATMSPHLLYPTVSASEEANAGLPEQYAMSKSQVQLTLDEGDFWHSFLDPSVVDVADARKKLESLWQKSENLSKSYERRNNAPTTRTYEESKLILQAMGVPCVEPDSPYEAEALAASLVRHGYADYVASEDTDVLVYEAPLLRNITNRQAPLMLLSGAEIRQVLRLDRPSYVDFALLLGTDFSQRIRNLGPQRAIKLIRTHGRIERVIANEPKFFPRLPADAYLQQVEAARLVFETLPPLPDPEFLRPMESNEGLVTALLDKHGVYREAMTDWDFASALKGNYFNDDPSMI